MGVFNLAAAQWDLSILSDVPYWVSTGTATLMYLMAFTNSVALSMDIKESTDQVYKDMVKTIDDMSRKVVDHKFRLFIDKFNWRTKRAQWKEEHENRMVKFNNRIPYKVHLAFEEKPKEKWNWKVKRWAKKRDKLEKAINDDWIDKNVKFLKYNYPMITPQEVRTGEVKKVQKKRLLTNNVIGKAVLKRLSSVGISIVLNGVISAMIWTGNPFSFGILMQIATQLFLVMLNIALGFKEGLHQTKQVTMNNLYTREDILTEYLSGQTTEELMSKNTIVNQ